MTRAESEFIMSEATSSVIESTLAGDVLDPLATLQWEKCCAMTEEDTNYFPSRMFRGDQKKYMDTVFLKGKFYLGVSYLDTTRHQMDEDVGWLFEFSEDMKSWKKLQPLPCVLFGLSTYRSRLVLVGGVDLETGRVTKKVWVSDDGTKPWQPSLPPLQKKRHSATVANTGNPECLVVAGGSSKQVEVLVEDHWVSIGPLPLHALPISYTVHNGNLFFVATLGAPHIFLYCKLQDLVSLCSQPGSITQPRGLWNLLGTSYFARGGYIGDISAYTLAFFGRQLIQIEDYCEDYERPTTLYALCAATKLWVPVAHIPEEIQCDTLRIVTALPSGALVLLGESGEDLIVLKASVKGDDLHSIPTNCDCMTHLV